MSKLSDNMGDKGFAKNVALKTLSSVLGKSGKPSSVKVKIKFGGKSGEDKPKRRKPQKQRLAFSRGGR